jgi:hypothetical protein
LQTAPCYYHEPAIHTTTDTAAIRISHLSQQHKAIAIAHRTFSPLADTNIQRKSTAFCLTTRTINVLRTALPIFLRPQESSLLVRYLHLTRFEAHWKEKDVTLITNQRPDARPYHELRTTSLSGNRAELRHLWCNKACKLWLRNQTGDGLPQHGYAEMAWVQRNQVSRILRVVGNYGCAIEMRIMIMVCVRVSWTRLYHLSWQGLQGRKAR